MPHRRTSTARPTRALIVVTTVVSLVLSAGCGAAPDTAPVAAESAPPQSQPGTRSMAVPESPSGHARAAVRALAEQIGLSEADISVVAAEAVTWPDASAGCPQPDMMYPQVLTPGYRIELSAAGRSYHFHGRRGG